MASPPSSIFRQYMIKNAAADRMLIVCRCTKCKRKRAYWAADLVAVGEGDVIVSEFERWCGYCQSYMFTRTSAHLPRSDHVGRFRILRPSGIQQTQIWKKVWFDIPMPELKKEDLLPIPPPWWNGRRNKGG